MTDQPFVTFEVHAEPVPLSRPRVTVRNGRAHAYIPEKAAAAQRVIYQAALRAKGARAPLIGPVAVEIIAYLKPPQSVLSAGKKGVVLPFRRPDLDNFVKEALDGMGCLWHDDAQVVELKASKRYAWEGEPRWWIEVRRYE